MIHTPPADVRTGALEGGDAALRDFVLCRGAADAADVVDAADAARDGGGRGDGGGDELFDGFPQLWAFKPSRHTWLGEGIRLHALHARDAASRQALRTWAYTHTDARVANWTLQSYVARPALWDGRKFDLRLWLALSSADPLRVWALDRAVPKVCSAMAGPRPRRTSCFNPKPPRRRWCPPPLPRCECSLDVLPFALARCESLRFEWLLSNARIIIISSWEGVSRTLLPRHDLAPRPAGLENRSRLARTCVRTVTRAPRAAASRPTPPQPPTPRPPRPTPPHRRTRSRAAWATAACTST